MLVRTVWAEIEPATGQIHQTKASGRVRSAGQTCLLDRY